MQNLKAVCATIIKNPASNTHDVILNLTEDEGRVIVSFPREPQARQFEPGKHYELAFNQLVGTGGRNT